MCLRTVSITDCASGHNWLVSVLVGLRCYSLEVEVTVPYNVTVNYNSKIQEDSLSHCWAHSEQLKVSAIRITSLTLFDMQPILNT